MKSREHYEGYSFALMDLAAEYKKISEIKKQSELLIEIFKSNSSYLKLLNSFELNIEQKKQILKKTFKDSINFILYRMILILIEKRRILEIVNILSLYVHHLNSISDTHKGLIYSTIELSPMEIKKITKKTEQKLHCKLLLENKIDKSLIGGFKIIVDDIVIDLSLLSSLEKMKRDILTKKGNKWH